MPTNTTPPRRDDKPMTKSQTPLDNPELLLRTAAALMRHRMLTGPPDLIRGGSPGWLDYIESRRTDGHRMKPWLARLSKHTLEESKSVKREDAPARTVFEELVLAADRARACTRRSDIVLRGVYDLAGAGKPADEMLVAQTVLAACDEAIRKGRLPEPKPEHVRGGRRPYGRENEECLETLHQTLGTSGTAAGRYRNASTAGAVRDAAREILVRRKILPGADPPETPPEASRRPRDPLLRPEGQKPLWRRAELPKEWLALAFNADPSGLDDEEEATARRTFHAEFESRGYAITSAAGEDDEKAPPTEALDGRWNGLDAEGCTLEYLGYDPKILEAERDRRIYCPHPVDGAEYLLDAKTEAAVWLPCNWTTVIEAGRWQHTPDDGDPWTDETVAALGPAEYDRWRSLETCRRPVRRLGTYPHVQTRRWNGRSVETTLWLVSSAPDCEQRARWPEKAPPLPPEILAETHDLPFTCAMCGVTDDTVPDPTTLEPDDDPSCTECTETIPGWGDAYESWPENGTPPRNANENENADA